MQNSFVCSKNIVKEHINMADVTEDANLLIGLALVTLGISVGLIVGLAVICSKVQGVPLT